MVQKSVVVFCLILFLSCGGKSGGGSSSSSVNSSPWKGSRQLGIAGQNTYGQGITSDPSANVYVTGFTSVGLDGNTLTGISDFFLTKYNSSGVKQWTKQLGVAGRTTYGKGITSDSSGNIFVTGETFGGLDGNTLIGSSGPFLTKYNSLGEKLWFKQLGVVGSSYINGNGIISDSSGNLYVMGYSSIGPDGNGIGTNGVWSVTKLNLTGEKQWSKEVGVTGAGVIQVDEITSDFSGNFYVTGTTKAGLDGNTQTGVYDFFVGKYDSNGNRKWTKQLGVAGGYTQGYGITSDPSANVYVTGPTIGSLDGILSNGGSSCFVTKFNSSGEKQWTWDCSGDSGGAGITSDFSGNLYVIGYGGPLDFFLTKYNSKGEKLWNKLVDTIRSPSIGRIKITSDPMGNIFVMGQVGLDGSTSDETTNLIIIKYNSLGEKQ